MSPPPPPPPPTDGEMMTMAMPMMTTPPPRQRKQHTGSSKSPVASPATSASSLASPTHVTKARMAADLMSPRMRGRMDPYPRYSPRKRLSADYSDGTYSVGSGAESPRSEKGGWRIHAAVAGPFLTGPLAREFRGEDFKSPRGKKKEEPDFDNNLGLLLFPVVPAFVPPAISPEVFQAAMNPAPAAPALTLTAAATQETTPAPPAETFAQQEAENNYVAPQATTESAEWNQNQTYDQASYQEYQQGYDQAAYEQAAYDQAAYDEYYQNQQHYAADQYNYAGYDQQQYGYDNYYAEAYHYQQTYESQEYVATEEHQQVAPSTTSEEAFPPLPHHEAEATVAAVETPVEAPAPSSPARRERAPSYADIVTGAAHSAPSPSPRKEVAKSPKKDPSQQIFEDMSAGIAESVNRILAKSKGKKTHSEIEFACLIQKISTQLKLMGKVSTSLKLEQAKTLHKLQKAEAEKTSIEASNAEMAALVKQYEQERDALKVQLAEALEAKDARLKDAVQQLTSKIDVLKSSKDASTAKIASEIDAIRSCGNPDDLEKRVDEIGQVLAHLIKSQSEAKPAPVAHRPSNMDGRRQSIGSWKAVALYAIIVWAASLCGVWIGVKYVASQPPLVNTPQPLALQDADLDLIMARLSEKYPSVETSRDDVAEVVAEVAAPVAPTSSNNDVVEVAVLDDASIAAVPNTWTEVTEPVATVEATPVENVAPIQRTSSTASCSPLSHVMYAWRPSFFEMAGTQDGSALNGLARALTSLSSQILSNHEETVVAASEPSVFEVVEDNTSSEPVAEITPVEQPIDDVSGSVIELADVAATEEIVAPVEIAEPVVATEEIVAVVEPVVAVVEEVAVTEAVNVSQPYAWELVAPEVVLPTVEEMLSSTPAAIEEIVEEVEVVEAVEEVVAEPEVMEAAVEVVQVVEEEEVVVVAPVEQVVEVVEAVSSNWVLPVETSAAPALQFSNASEVVVAKAELETLAVDGMCSVPALDLRSHLL